MRIIGLFTLGMNSHFLLCLQSTCCTGCALLSGQRMLNANEDACICVHYFIHIKSKTHLRSCSKCEPDSWGYRGIHQSAGAVAVINYPGLRAISPQFCLFLHACPITFLTAHYKGQGDTQLTKERSTDWNIFCASNMSWLLQSCSLHFSH